jgi:mono/diheme cytochrome c family protein
MHIFRAAACMLILAATGTSATAGEPASLPYRVVGGKVDAATYTGWRVYHQACYLCHGVDAVGTALAPSLVDKLRDLTAAQFAVKVATSYRIILGLEAAGGDDPTAMREAMMAEVTRKEDPILLMPAWEGDKRVQPHLSDLYAYLKARSDGALGPGKPRPLSGR